MEPLEINGVPPSLAGRRCDAIFCQQYWHCGRLEDQSNVAFLCFDGRWSRLYFDHGIIFWRPSKQGPKPFEAPEINASYPINDVATALGLIGLTLLHYEMEPIERGSRVIFKFANGQRLAFTNVDDVTSCHDA